MTLAPRRKFDYRLGTGILIGIAIALLWNGATRVWDELKLPDEAPFSELIIANIRPGASKPAIRHDLGDPLIIYVHDDHSEEWHYRRCPSSFLSGLHVKTLTVHFDSSGILKKKEIGGFDC